MSDFGNRLKLLRENQHLSQKELANILNVGNSTLSQYESGKRVPADDVKMQIAQYFNVSLDYLLGNETPTLTEKDEKDIAKSMERLKDQLKNSQGLMFDGEPLDEETKSLLLEELERQERLVKTINKKYIPKKFRK